MDKGNLPVAKRTRLAREALDKVLYDQYIVKMVKKARTTGVPVPEADVVPPVEIIDLEDDDEGLICDNKGESSSKRCGESVGTDLDEHVDDDDDDDDDGNEKEVIDVDSSSTEDDCREYDDETHRGDDSSRSDSEESFDDLRSYAESDEGKDESDDEEEMDDVCKGNGKLIEGGRSKNIKNNRRKQKMIDGRLKEKVNTFERVNSRKDGQPIGEAEEAVEFDSSSEYSDNGSGRKYVRKDVGGRRKNPRTGTGSKALKNLDRLKILGDSLHDKGEGLEKFAEKKLEYKFWFTDKKEKPVEKSESEKELDIIWGQLDKDPYGEESDSTPPEVDSGDHHSKTETDWATLCSQGNHPHLFLDEQVGIVCECCSVVVQEIRHILPAFSKPSSQSRSRDNYVQSERCRRDNCVQSESLISFDHFQDTGAKRHEFENYTSTGTVWDLVPETRRSMYEHQREGFEFIWKNLAGGIIIEKLEKPLSSSGSGCIISHAPGTGKTRLTIVFLQSFMKLYPNSRPVIIAPKSMLLTWEEEFRKWNINIPFHNMNNLEFSGQENPAAVSFSKPIRGSREIVPRIVKLLSWKMDKSILGITYTLFDKFVGGTTRNAGCTPIVEQMGKALLKLPSLIVLDEGHTPRNDQSCIYNSLLDVETKRRIILSGTPFQNNFTELYNTMCLVNPEFGRTSSKSDGKMKKSMRKIGKEIQSKGSREKLRELKCMISPFVHVHKGNILQKSCPGLKDALILLQPTDLQQELIALLNTDGLNAGYLELSHAISLVSVHPSLLPEHYLQEHQFSTYRDRLERLKRDPYFGAKTKFVVELCRLSEALNEKVLIYSQYIDPLIFTKKQLQTYFGWTEGREVLYMDGGLEAKQRQSLISSLNDPRSNVRVLLASIKACSEGIHLVGASRVVLLDVVWNPSVERQAISRAYRLGQKKIVYTYHLIAEEMEMQKYKAQTAKDRLSEMVFSWKDMDSYKENMPDTVSEDKILQEMFQRNDKLGGMFKQIIYQPRESNLVYTFGLVAEE